MRRILFVVDASLSVELLRRSIVAREHAWDIRTSPDEAGAVGLIQDWAPDAVVAVAHPGLDGVALLTRLRDESPDAVRILVGARGEDEDGLRAMRIAHRALPEPLDANALIEALRRTLLLRDLVRHAPMRALLARIGKLPPVPSVYARLTRRLDDPSVSVFELGRILSDDPALSAQVLRIANSAYFAHGYTVSQITAAAARLGTRLLRSLVLTAEVYNRLPISPFMVERLEELQQHSSLVARIACSLEPGAPWKDDAFSAGLLHDVGKLVLATHEPDVHAAIVLEAERNGSWHHLVEMERLGAHHATLGACLLGMWGLPSAILDAVQGHHDLADPIPSPLDAAAAVAIADLLAHSVQPDLRGSAQSSPALARAGQDPRWPAWFELARNQAEDAAA